MAVPSEYAALAQRLRALDGNEYVYTESFDVFRVRISDIVEWEDGRGFRATATALSTPGLPEAKRASWQFGGTWDGVHATANVITCSFVRWRVLTSASALPTLLQILSQVPPGQTYRFGSTKAPAPLGRPVIAIVTPGPAWVQVREFLDTQR